MGAFQWNSPFVCSKRFSVWLKRKRYVQLNDLCILVLSLSNHLCFFYDCPMGVKNTHNHVLFCKHMLNSLQTESNVHLLMDNALAIDSVAVGNTNKKHSICSETMISSKQLENFGVISSTGTQTMAWGVSSKFAHWQPLRVLLAGEGVNLHVWVCSGCWC